MQRQLMKVTSAITHQFYQDKEASDNGCLYESFRFSNGTLKSSSNEVVRNLVADYILRHKNVHSLVPTEDIKGYCKQVEKGKLLGGKVELQALSWISRLVIHVISIASKANGTVDIKKLDYDAGQGIFNICIYLLYNEKNNHYHPLYMINEEDPNEKITIFPLNDEVVDEVLEKFIRNEFNTSQSQPNEKEPPNEPITSHVIEQLVVNETVPIASTNMSNKRKLPSPAEFSFGKIVDPQPSSTCTSDVVEKPNKLAKRNVDNASDNEDIKQSTTILNENDEKLEMKLEVEPAEEFLGRTRGDFFPKESTNGDSEARPPRYFADRNGKHVFNLLIPEKYLSSGAEHRAKICLITHDIDQCSYVQSNFKFQGHPTDANIPDKNPIYHPFSMEDLEEHSEEMRQLPLRLVVVKQTIGQIRNTLEPLEIYSSSNNGTAIMTVYNDHKALKKAYDLKLLRFAFTLEKKAAGESEFLPCDAAQYVSQLSTATTRYEKSSKRDKTVQKN